MGRLCNEAPAAFCGAIYHRASPSPSFQIPPQKMDPLSITTSATAILAICLQAVHLIQRTIETVKNARKLLVKLLSQTERLRLILEQLRSLTKQLGTRAGGLVLSYNDSGPKTTINDLNVLVRSIAEKTNFVSLQMLLNKSKVDTLVEKMKLHEEEVVTVLLSIAR
jgi:division protein CdvB (Snf7/Vps24/ESCRT-III family)